MKKTLSLIAAGLLLPLAVHAQEAGALLDLLEKKKVITPQEAEQVRADLVKEFTGTPAGKINVGSWVKEMKITGDIRERYTWENSDPHTATLGKNVNPGNGDQLSRWRFRLRIRDEFKLANNWFGGVELSTGAGSDSGNQTYGDTKLLGSGGSAASSGFGKYGLFISRAYIGWNAAGWLTLIAGKQANPFYTTDLVWSQDINPDGLVEQVKFHKIYLGDNASGVREQRPWELTLNAGQFIFSDNKESTAATPVAGHGNSTDAYLFAAQLQGSYKFSNNLKATVAPGFLIYNAASLAGLNNQTSFPSSGVTTSGTVGIAETRDLAILTLPGDLAYKFGNLPVKFYWDFAYNTAGKDRYNKVYGPLSRPHSAQDDIAWLAGVQVGDNKKAGDWSLNANFRQNGISAIDPNLNDQNFANGQLNTQGFKFGGLYNFTDFVTGAVTYYYAWNLRNDIAGGQATGGAGLANANNIQILQVDLSVKF